MGRVPTWKFVAYNFLGACLWAPLVAIAGYIFGHAIQLLIKDSERFQMAIFAVIAIVGIGLWWYHRKD
jgi:membrane protein DedA with SNARE-associated domain